MEDEKKIKFELGKCYEHECGEQIRIIAKIDTTIYGECFVSEDIYGNLKPCGMSEENAKGYYEISEDEWKRNFNIEQQEDSKQEEKQR